MDIGKTVHQGRVSNGQSVSDIKHQASVVCQLVTCIFRSTHYTVFDIVFFLHLKYYLSPTIPLRSRQFGETSGLH